MAAAETASDSSANNPAAKEEAALPIPDKPSEIDSVDGIDVDEEDAGYWDDGQFDVLELHDRVPCDIEQSDPFIGMQHSSAQSDANAADYDFMLQR